MTSVLYMCVDIFNICVDICVEYAERREVLILRYPSTYKHLIAFLTFGFQNLELWSWEYVESLQVNWHFLYYCIFVSKGLYDFKIGGPDRILGLWIFLSEWNWLRGTGFPCVFMVSNSFTGLHGFDLCWLTLKIEIQGLSSRRNILFRSFQIRMVISTVCTPLTFISASWSIS